LSWWHKKKDGTKQNNGEEAMNSDQAVQKKTPDSNWFSPFQSLLYNLSMHICTYIMEFAENHGTHLSWVPSMKESVSVSSEKVDIDCKGLQGFTGVHSFFLQYL
jgi:hypothetical protein